MPLNLQHSAYYARITGDPDLEDILLPTSAGDDSPALQENHTQGFDDLDFYRENALHYSDLLLFDSCVRTSENQCSAAAIQIAR